MKKSFFGTLYLVTLSLIMASCGGSDRAHQLKVLNWADYINEDVKENFEKWYFEQTGEKVELVYETFDINETALTKIEVGHEDYDVFCPSEYIIERMLKKDLLIPIQKDLIPDSIYYLSLFSLRKLIYINTLSITSRMIVNSGRSSGVRPPLRASE